MHIDHGVSPPKVVWQPAGDDLAHEQLQFLLSYWKNLSDDGGHVIADEIDPLNMWPALGFVILVDVIEKGEDFRIRVYGSAIAQSVEVDVTGKLISQTPWQGVVMEFFYAVYRAVVIRPEPLYTEHEPPMDVGVKLWHRLMLPLVDGDGEVCRVLVGNVPGEWRKPVKDDPQ